MKPDKSEAEAAKHFGKSVDTLRRMRKLGTAPPFYRVGRTVLFRSEDIDAWLESHRVVPYACRPGRSTILGAAA